MKKLTNKLGPFKHYTAEDVKACLSTKAENVRTETTPHGHFVVFELPEGASIWKVGES